MGSSVVRSSYNFLVGVVAVVYVFVEVCAFEQIQKPLAVGGIVPDIRVHDEGSHILICHVVNCCPCLLAQ